MYGLVLSGSARETWSVFVITPAGLPLARDGNSAVSKCKQLSICISSLSRFSIMMYSEVAFSFVNTPAGLPLAKGGNSADSECFATLARGSHSDSECELLFSSFMSSIIILVVTPSSGDNDVVDSSVSLNSIDSGVEVDVAGVSGCGRSGKLEVVYLCDGHCMLDIM